MKKITFKKETMNEQLPESLYAIESHMGGVYFDDVYLDLDDDYSDPYYCDSCGDSDWPIGPVETPLELLALLIEYDDYREDIREMSDKDIADCLNRFIDYGCAEIVIEEKDFNDALHALIEYRESAK